MITGTECSMSVDINMTRCASNVERHWDCNQIRSTSLEGIFSQKALRDPLGIILKTSIYIGG